VNLQLLCPYDCPENNRFFLVDPHHQKKRSLKTEGHPLRDVDLDAYDQNSTTVAYVELPPIINRRMPAVLLRPFHSDDESLRAEQASRRRIRTLIYARDSLNC
jgi:hypothetical protein